MRARTSFSRGPRTLGTTRRAVGASAPGVAGHDKKPVQPGCTGFFCQCSLCAVAEAPRAANLLRNLYRDPSDRAGGIPYLEYRHLAGFEVSDNLCKRLH